MTTEFMPTFRYAGERDVDLLVVEELLCSRKSLELFCLEARLPFLPKDIKSWDVKHSVGRQLSRREIDIRVHIEMFDGCRVCILLENKLGEKEQPRQAESYLEECEELTKLTKFEHAWCGLIAPTRYINENSSFATKFFSIRRYDEKSEIFW